MKEGEVASTLRNGFFVFCLLIAMLTYIFKSLEVNREQVGGFVLILIFIIAMFKN